MVLICNTTYTSLEFQSHFEKYPYSLSDFQKYAIEAIVKGDHVLITAHTGSGKTLPAEFAIQHFVGKGKKVIYTSPIKALSNQKYYEFSLKYPEISFGLFTGDIKTNPEADVLIMTTEILMNALISRDNSKTNPNHFSIDLETELAAVVFDEVHYINDADRGQNWEKTLLMLPAHIQKIMLSATIDSPERFAKWVENLSTSSSLKEEKNDKKTVYLCSTNHRVVPLTHYGFFVVNESALKNIKDKSIQQEMRKLTGEKIRIQNDKGVFQETEYMQIKRIAKYFEKEIVHRKQVLNQLALYLRNNEMLPAIFFVFSRKNVEAFARDITIPVLEDDSKIPYTVKRECDAILRKLPNWEEYTALPEYHFLVGLLEKGIGIHHSGMVPIFREIVELMISKKYIKILFATESFAIGLDCPIKTAVFTGLTKFDGSDHRWLMAHEYTQMAGRAGRRGIDTIGHVIHCNNLFELPTRTEYRDILCGKAQSLISKFRISYSWVLATSVILVEENPIALSKKSMIYEELERMIVSQKENMCSLEKDILSRQTEIARIPYSLDHCRKYNEIQETIGTAVNKKKKEKQREIETLETEYRTIRQDAKRVKDLDVWLEMKIKEEAQLSFLETYIETQLEKVQRVLQENKYFELGGGLSSLGNIASKMSEVHPLVWSGCMVEKWNYFADFSVKQIVGILSCITDIKVPEEYRRYMSSSFLQDKNAFLQDRLMELQKEYEKYEKIEEERELRTGMKYTDVLSFDIVEEAMQWCDCESEEECKVFISCELSKKEIGLGDFTKAMLKIATVAREWSAIPEIAEKVSLSYKLMQIDTMVLKYIATNQSLYV